MATYLGAIGGDSSLQSAMLTISPSFRPFPPDATSHEAASIVGLSYGEHSSGVLATHVVVGHRPYQILSFSVLELDGNGGVVQRSVSRERLQSGTAEEIAAELGPPLIDESQAISAPEMSQGDMLQLAAVAFNTILNDSYARPLYPPEGIESLLADTPLIQKWAMVQSSRFAAAALPRIIPICSSSSTSCNSCTSTSTSVIPIPIRV